MWTWIVAQLGAVLLIVTAAAVAGAGWLFPSDGPVLLVVGDHFELRNNVRDRNIMLLDFDRGFWVHVARLETAIGISPSPSPDGSAQVITAGDEIYRIDVPSLDIMNLTNTPGLLEQSPSWAPDGTQIAFTMDSFEGDQNELFVMNADGTNRVKIAELPSGVVWPLAWSPNGDRLAFTLRSDSVFTENAGVYVINADGSDLRRISEHAGGVRWSPAATLIAFPGPRSIVVTNDAGLVKYHLPRDLSFRWSPDGNLIAYVDKDVMLFDLRDGTSRKLASAPHDAPAIRPISWSPDGSKFLLYVGNERAGEFFIVNLEGEIRDISSNPEFNEVVAQWSSDATRYIFLAEDKRTQEIVVCMADVEAESTRCQSTSYQTIHTSITWLP